MIYLRSLVLQHLLQSPLSRRGPWLLCVAAAALAGGLGAARADLVFPDGPPGGFLQPRKTQATAKMEKANAQFQAGKIDDCLKLLQEARKAAPGLPPAELSLARLFFSAGRYPQGRYFLERAAVAAPDDPDVYATFADLARHERRWTDAWVLYEKALALDLPKVWPAKEKKLFRKNALAGMATVAENRGDWPAAERLCREWLPLDESGALARQGLAQALFFQEQTEAALEELRAARKQDAKLPPAEMTIGLLFDRQRNAEQAEKWLKAAIDKEPQHVGARLEYAHWLLAQRRVGDAKEQLQTIADAGELAKRAALLGGLVARHEEDYPSAERCFSELHRESPTDFVVGNQLALTLVELPDESKRGRALQIAQANAQRFPRLAEALATLGWVQFRLGNPESAEKTLRAAIAPGQASPDTAYFLSRVLKSRGKDKEARKFLNAALESKGLFVCQRQARTRLEKAGSPEVP